MNTWVSFQSAEQPLLGQFSVSGNNLPSRGLATMGTGIWTVLTAPPVAYAVAKFAKGLNFVKEMTEKVERAERPRGATRLAADLDAIDNHYRQPENKGPSPRGLR
ncbi:hypothetical protein [Pseudomonas aeruginosa]|uniref:hypothetical protein n=1 Tax=Pseudomonas aeruginosa TaxID=287 RepID=UPI0013C45CCB|nr:hypothetical protein [Pseudomonas aeruginosa]